MGRRIAEEEEIRHASDYDDLNFTKSRLGEAEERHRFLLYGYEPDTDIPDYESLMEGAFAQHRGVCSHVGDRSKTDPYA